MELPRRGRRRKASRIAVLAEATRIAEYRALIRSLDQAGAMLRSPLPAEPHNLAHKLIREPQPLGQINR